MANGLINYGIVKPELATSFATGFQEAQTQGLRQRAAEQQLEFSQEKLSQLKNDRAMMLQLQDQLKAAGKNPDLNTVFDALIQTGNPDYVVKGIEGKRRLAEQTRAEAILRREAPELFGGTSTAAPATPNVLAGGMPPAPAPGAEGGFTPMPVAPAPTAAPANALAAPAAAPAPVNAMAQPGAPDARIQELRRKILTYRLIDDPRLKSLADVYEAELKELTKTHTVGGRIVSGAGREIYTAPSEIGTLEQEISVLRSQGVPLTDPRIVARQNKITKLTTHQPSTQIVMPPQEKAEQTERGKLLVEDYKTISNAARVASKTLPAIETNLKILDKGFDTGFGTEVKAAGANILSALGVKDATQFASDAQIFKSKVSETVLEKQLLQKGPQTEADAQRITQTSAQLGNTKQANQFLLDVAKAQLKRDMDQRNFYDQWWKQNKTYDGAEGAWYDGEGGKSLFDRPELKKYGMSSAPSRTAPAAAKPAAPAIGMVQDGYRFKGGDPSVPSNWEKVKK